MIQVFHIDADPSFGEIVQLFLEHENEEIEVISLTSTSEGLRYLEGEGEIDCIVSGRQMMDIDGIEFVRRVRERCPLLPVIMYSSFEEPTKHQALQAGATEYIQKETGLESYSKLARQIAVHAEPA